MNKIDVIHVFCKSLKQLDPSQDPPLPSLSINQIFVSQVQPRLTNFQTFLWIWLTTSDKKLCNFFTKSFLSLYAILYIAFTFYPLFILSAMFGLYQIMSWPLFVKLGLYVRQMQFVKHLQYLHNTGDLHLSMQDFLKMSEPHWHMSNFVLTNFSHF